MVLFKQMKNYKTDTVLYTKPPGVSFRQALKPIKGHACQEPSLRSKAQAFACGNWNYCSKMIKGSSFKDLFLNKTYLIEDFINCNTTHVIYRLHCSCKHFYIGITIRRLRDRVVEHRYAIRTRNLNRPVANYYPEAKYTVLQQCQESSRFHVAPGVQTNLSALSRERLIGSTHSRPLSMRTLTFLLSPLGFHFGLYALVYVYTVYITQCIQFVHVHIQYLYFLYILRFHLL